MGMVAEMATAVVKQPTRGVRRTLQALVCLLLAVAPAGPASAQELLRPLQWGPVAQAPCKEAVEAGKYHPGCKVTLTQIEGDWYCAEGVK